MAHGVCVSHSLSETSRTCPCSEHLQTDKMPVGALDVADVAGIEVLGDDVGPSVEDRELTLPGDDVEPLVRVLVPMHLAHAARVDGHVRGRDALGDLEVSRIGDANLPPRIFLTGGRSARRKVEGSSGPPREPRGLDPAGPDVEVV